MQDNEKWCSMKEITEHLGVSRETVLNWIEKGGMPTTKAGRLWKFKISEVDAWLKQGGPKTALPSLGTIQFNSMFSIAQRLTNDKLHNPPHSVYGYKSMLYIYISAIAGRTPQVKYFPEDLEEMTNEALCIFLIRWLHNAPNTRQTCGSFATQAFTLTDDNHSGNRGEYNAEREHDIARGIKEYYRNINQSKNTQPSKENIGTRREYSFIALCFADFYRSKDSKKSSATSDLKLYRDLVNSENPNDVTSTKARDAIIQGYENYLEMIRLITYEKNTVALVSKILTIIEFEMVHRFLLSYQIVKSKFNNSAIDYNVVLQKIANYYRPIPCQEFPDSGMPIASVRKADQLIEKACNNTLTADDRTKMYFARIIVQAAVAILCNFCSDHLTQKWTMKTFEEAAHFLTNEKEYNFEELVNSANLDFLLEDGNQYAKATELRQMSLYNILDIKSLNNYRNFILPERKAENQRRKKADTK